METIGGLPATGRRLRGPASDLMELDSERGLKHTAVVFHSEYRGHPGINDALTVVRGFLESPMVTGLVELVGDDPEAGAFIYPTGQCWSVAEVIRKLADYGEPAGVRAGLELMYAAGQILGEAAETGDSQGVYSHGGLTPWRIMLRKDGQILIIGHALPQIEVLLFHADSSQVPREDSFRYCPPERMEAAAEDLSSDLFGLSLIAFELMTGKPVYDGLVNDIRQQAARGEGSRRLFRFRDVLPPKVRELLTDALRPDQADRFRTAEDFVQGVRACLSGPDATGPSLMDVMARISTQTTRSAAQVDSASTMMASRDELRAMLDDGDEEYARERDGSGRSQSWSPAPDRAPRAAAAPAPEPESEPAPTDGDSRWSRPKGPRRPRSAAAPEAEAEPESTPSNGSSERWSKPTGRRPRRAVPEEAPPTEAETPAPAAGGDRWSKPAGRRPRRAAGVVDDAPLAAPVAPPPAAEPPPDSPLTSPDAPPAWARSSGRRPRRSARSDGEMPVPMGLPSPEPVADAAPPPVPSADGETSGPRKPRTPRRIRRPTLEADADSADDLLARIRSSASRSGKPSAARENERKSAEGVISAILESSGQSKDLKERLRRARERMAVAGGEAEPTASPEADAAPRFQSGRARAPRRARPSDAGPSDLASVIGEALAAPSEPAPVVAESAPVVVPAPALEPEPEPAPAHPPAPPPIPVAPPAAARTPVAPGLSGPRSERVAKIVDAPIEDLAPPVDVASAVGDEPSVPTAEPDFPPMSEPPAAPALADSPPAVVPAPVREPPVADTPAPTPGIPAAAVAVAGTTGFAAASSLARTPDAIPSAGGSKGAASFSILRGVGGRAARMRLPLGATTAEAVAWLIGNVVPVRTDLCGRVTGWYRLADGDARLPADTLLGELDASRQLTLVFVPAGTALADIEVIGGAVPARFVAPVGTAIPAATLVDHLCSWLELPAGKWHLACGERTIQPHGILADLGALPDLIRLQLRLGGGK